MLKFALVAKRAATLSEIGANGHCDRTLAERVVKMDADEMMVDVIMRDS
jgi:hypothetical protein